MNDELDDQAEARVDELAAIAGPAVGAAEHRPGWRGVAREFATIVAGVLVALAGQAWWDGRQEAARESEYLRQLLVDTRDNERQMADALLIDREVRDANHALSTALYAPRPLPSPDSLRALFTAPVFSSSNLQPRAGTYTALLSSGDIRLIHTDSLRAQIVAYAAQLQSDEDMFRLYFEQAFLDPGRLAKVMPFVRRMLLELPDSEEVVARKADVATYLHLRDDPEVAGVIFSLRVANNNRIAHLRNLLRVTRDLRHALEAEPALRAIVRRLAVADSARAADSARVADSVRAGGASAVRR
jgi:hypothetical protein